MSPATLEAPQQARPSTPPPGTRSAEQIRSEIVVRREELGRDVKSLRGRLNELTDIGLQVQRHKKELAVGTGILVGLGAAAILARRQGD